jgi:hypothetical protein
MKEPLILSREVAPEQKSLQSMMKFSFIIGHHFLTKADDMEGAPLCLLYARRGGDSRERSEAVRRRTIQRGVARPR